MNAAEKAISENIFSNRSPTLFKPELFFFSISSNVNSMLKMLRLSVQCQNRLNLSENWKFKLFKHNPDVWLLIIFQERGNLCNTKFIHAYFISAFPITELKISNICFPRTDNVLN